MQVYFDNSSTTKIHPKVLEAMLPYLKENYGNPSSIHYHGRKARVAIESARELIADFLNAIPSEIYFTSGGTEAINFILNGIAKVNFSETGKNQIITTNIEHKAVLDTIYDLSNSGYISKHIMTDKNGAYISELLDESISDRTSLVSIMHTNNELGIINDIASISTKLSADQYLFSDCVQAFGKERIDVNKLKVDALSASAHKIYGPKGMGIAFVKSGTPLQSYIFGGSQERNRRGGTENVAAIVGIAEAVKLADSNLENNKDIVKGIKDYFIDGLDSIFGNKVEINGGTNVSPYILNITFKDEFFNNDIDTLLMTLDINGIAASQGSACTSGTIKPSHVITGIGKSIKDASGTLRFSFNPGNTFGEVDYVLSVLKKIGQQTKK